MKKSEGKLCDRIIKLYYEIKYKEKCLVDQIIFLNISNLHFLIELLILHKKDYPSVYYCILNAITLNPDFLQIK